MGAIIAARRRTRHCDRPYLVRVADVVAGRYELAELIGTGGNGRVFAGRDRVLDRRVAVKLVDAEAVRHRDPAGRERFLAEARSSAGFTHPNAVAVFDAGEADGSLFLVMELVEGETLAARLAREGPLDPAVAARIAGDVLAALDAAHRAGIVHRDVKPANVLLDARGTAKLADFGIAKRLDSVAASLTNPGQFFGTPKYLAPEQVDGRSVSGATDVYATGIVLFEMLSGRPPFDEGQPMATAMAQRDAQVPDLRTMRPDVPDVLVAVVDRALRKDPHERFASAAAMRAALTAPLWPAPRPAADTSAADATRAMATTNADATTVLAAPRRTPPASGRAQGAQRPAAVAPTATMPRSNPTFRVPRRRSRATGVLVTMIAAIAVAALVAAFAVRGNDDPGDTDAATRPPGEVVPETNESAASGPASPAGTAGQLPVLPSDVPMLVDFLAQDPSVVGARGEELLKELRKVVGRNGDKQGEAAEELRSKIDEWVGDDELDASIGSLAQQLLDRLAQAAAGQDADDDGDD
jgi:serine/threonine-protein kinase